MVLVVLGMNVKKGGIDGMNGMSHHAAIGRLFRYLTKLPVAPPLQNSPFWGVNFLILGG